MYTKRILSLAALAGASAERLTNLRLLRHSAPERRALLDRVRALQLEGFDLPPSATCLLAQTDPAGAAQKCCPCADPDDGICSILWCMNLDPENLSLKDEGNCDCAQIRDGCAQVEPLFALAAGMVEGLPEICEEVRNCCPEEGAVTSVARGGRRAEEADATAAEAPTATTTMTDAEGGHEEEAATTEITTTEITDAEGGHEEVTTTEITTIEITDAEGGHEEITMTEITTTEITTTEITITNITTTEITAEVAAAAAAEASTEAPIEAATEAPIEAATFASAGANDRQGEEDVLLCATIWMPVCGADSKVYSNDCEAGNAGQLVLYNIKPTDDRYANGDECPPAETVDLPGDSLVGQVELEEGLGIACPAIWAPVCADGTVYGNDCEAGAEGKEVQYEIADDGATPGEDCPPEKPAVATEEDQIACPAIWAPVCADGIVYSNDCEAGAKGKEVQYEIASPDGATPGEACPPEKPAEKPADDVETADVAGTDAAADDADDGPESDASRDDGAAEAPADTDTTGVSAKGDATEASADADAAETPAETDATEPTADTDATEAPADTEAPAEDDTEAEARKSATDAFNQCMIAARDAGRVAVPDLSIIGGIPVLEGDGVCPEKEDETDAEEKTEDKTDETSDEGADPLEGGTPDSGAGERGVAAMALVGASLAIAMV